MPERPPFFENLDPTLCFRGGSMNDRGVVSLSYTITIRRRYRGFTSLWLRRDSKVSTALLRARQNGLHVHRVFQILLLTTAPASLCFMRL